MTDNLVQLRTCPRCGGVYSGHGAVSSTTTSNRFDRD